MAEIPPLPELPPPEQQPAWVGALLRAIAAQAEQIHRLREANQALRDEVARLKGRTPVVGAGGRCRGFLGGASGGRWRGYFVLARDALFNPGDARVPFTLLFGTRPWIPIPPLPATRFRGLTYAAPLPPLWPGTHPSRRRRPPDRHALPGPTVIRAPGPPSLKDILGIDERMASTGPEWLEATLDVLNLGGDSALTWSKQPRPTKGEHDGELRRADIP